MAILVYKYDIHPKPDGVARTTSSKGTTMTTFNARDLTRNNWPQLKCGHTIITDWGEHLTVVYMERGHQLTLALKGVLSGPELCVSLGEKPGLRHISGSLRSSSQTLHADKMRSVAA